MSATDGAEDPRPRRGHVPDWLPRTEVPEPGGDALLRDPSAAWRLIEGTVELSLVQVAEERLRARWTPLFTVQPGALVTGIPPAKRTALVARTSPDAVLEPVDLDALDAEDEATIDALEQSLLGMLESVRSLVDPEQGEAHPLTPGDDPDRHDFDLRHLGVPRVVAMAAGQIAQPAQRLSWVTVERGRARMLGRERSVELSPRGPVPFGGADWVLAETDTVLRTMRTSEVVAEGRLVSALGAFGVELRETVGRRVYRQTARERALIEKRELRDESVLRVADTDFAAILDSQVDRLRAMSDRPAYAALQAIGEHLGVEIRSPRLSEAEAEREREDLITQIARASRLSTRAVSLEGNWWRRDIGPLVGFLDDDETPVALLPHGRITVGSGYVMRDPETRRSVPVDAALAGRLSAGARQFYLPFPDRPVTRRDLLRHGLHGARGDLRLLVLTGLAVAALGLLVPVISGRILGHLVPKDERNLISLLCVLLLLSASVATMLNTVFNLVGLRLEGRLDHSFQAAVWDRLMSLPVPFFRGFSTGELATAALGISDAREIVSGLVLKGVLGVLVAIADFVLICFYDLRLALLALVVAAVALGISVLAGRRMIEHQTAAHEVEKQVNSRTFQIITGVAKISTAAAEPRAYAHWARAFADGRENTYRARLAENRLAAVNATLTLLAAAAAFFVVIELIPGLPESHFIAFNIAFFQIMGSLLQISGAMILVVNVTPTLRSLGPILSTVPEVPADAEGAASLSGHIAVRNVTFSYAEGDRAALTDVSLTIRPGEFVGIVGPSGCGKSTLLRLLLGFETPDSGTVAYDGRDLAGLDPLSVRRQCGVVMQNAVLFAGDILSNIVGSGLYSHDEAWEAVKLCGMDEELGALPMGMFTMLSDGGGALSGGQRQRLLLARAFVSRPRILLLDEATSALDNRSQQTVSESMAALRATRVVIAHRLSTIERADRILVLDGGRVVQEGTYAELLEEDGLFRELARRQLA